MRVFHGPENLGGMAGVLAQAQRALGVDAVSYCREAPAYGFRTDRQFTYGSKPLQLVERLKFMATDAFSFDVFHFYFGASLAGQQLTDVPWLKRLGKRIFFYFCGCDIRDSKATMAKYEISACADCWPMTCNANRRKALDMVAKYADGSFVSTPDLLEFVPGSVLLPQPIDLERFNGMRDRALKGAEPSHQDRRVANRNVVVAHAPTARMLKGTKYLQEAIESLRRRGVGVELRLVEKVSHTAAIRRSAQADLVVDQLLFGSYGQYAVEMMALGKPVICYIRPDLKEHYPPSLPIVSATPENIAAVILELIERRDEWSELGHRGVQYVREVHDSIKVARRALDCYESEARRCA